jgi:hypothetical protein
MMSGEGEFDKEIAKWVLNKRELGGVEEQEHAVGALWWSWSCMIENMIMWGVEGREWLNICWWIVGCLCGSGRIGNLRMEQEVFYRQE